MRLASAKVHFIGIGGIGMCGLAELLHNMGAHVTGSDQTENQQTQRLRNLGVPVVLGHSPDNVLGVDVVVYSSAVKSDNVEYQESRRRRIPLIPRAEALAELMHLKRGVAVAGTHGKTTTTSFTAAVFLEARLDPTIVVGGRLDVIQSTALLGKSEWLIAEADESDGSFTRLSPETVIITNVDDDHLDHYGSFAAVKSAFREFALRIPFYGAVIACGDERAVREVLHEFPKRVVFYGFQETNEFFLKGDNRHYMICHRNLAGEVTEVASVEMPVPGRHNALNALAAILAGREAGVEWDVAVRGIAGFGGVDRRFQKKGEAGGVSVYDDYGHHPTEVKAVLSAFREAFPGRRLVVLFQPHRYSRTQLCWHSFLDAFASADRVFLLDIYAAGEAPLPGISSSQLVREMHHPHCEHLGTPVEAQERLRRELQPNDVFVTLGAGDVWKVGESLVQVLR